MKAQSLLTIGVALLASSNAQKVDCSSDEKGSLFAKGRRDASKFAVSKWRNRCIDATQFESRLIASIPKVDPKHNACYVHGYEMGVDTFVKSLTRKCPGRGACMKNGNEVGEYAARIFCNMPSNGAVPISIGCPEANPENCKYVFDLSVAKNCPGKDGHQAFKISYCAMEPQADEYLPDN